jgi:hypothetical protein
MQPLWRVSWRYLFFLSSTSKSLMVSKRITCCYKTFRKSTTGRNLRIKSAPTFFVAINFVFYCREGKTQGHSTWHNLWSKTAREQHSHAITSIHLYPTSSRESAYLVKCSIETPYYPTTVHRPKNIIKCLMAHHFHMRQPYWNKL